MVDEVRDFRGWIALMLRLIIVRFYCADESIR